MDKTYVRVRIAPSPTGVPHPGNARAALVNYIFAKQQNGKFLMRIEDTDVERSLPEYKDALFDMIHWLNIAYDEEPIIQSTRFDIYREKAMFLFNNNYAYYCICAKPIDDSEVTICNCKSQKYTKGVLRFNVIKGFELCYNDLIYGELSVNTDNIEDFALLRSDGIPTYHLCVVIDDIGSNITHIIRGEDHRTNTFKQMLLYNAFNAKIPQFAHMPMILGTDGKKLSKRNGGSSIEFFRSQGIDYRAMINSMMRLGWNLNGQERLTESEFLEFFNIKDMLRKAAKLDIDKMNRDSQFFIKEDAVNNILSSKKQFNSFTKRYFNIELNIIEKYPRIYLNAVEKSKTYLEIYNYILFMYKNTSIDINQEQFNAIENYIKEHTSYFQKDFTLEVADKIIKDLVSLKLHKTLRLILMHSNIGLDLTESLYALGLQKFNDKILFAKTNTR